MGNSQERDEQRYLAALHAVQSGVAAKMNYDPTETTPKHLRVGVNAAMVQDSALAQLLMRKGMITEGEYWSAIADAMEREQALYEQWLADQTGTPVHLR